MTVRSLIAPLTGVRGIASAWVVLLHLQLLVPVLLPRVPVVGSVIDGGNLGVDVFFVLSGFIISFTYLDRLSARAPGAVSRYLWLRFARIYPTHLFMLLVVAGLLTAMTIAGMQPHDDRRFSPLSFVMNLLMLQAVPPALAWNDPAWSISTEFAAYLVFPLLVPLLARVLLKRALIGLLVLLAVGMTAIGVVLATASDWAYWAGYVLMWTRIAVCFPLGCLLYVLWRSLPQDGRRRAATIALPVSIIGLLLACILTPTPGPVTLPVAAYPFIVLMIFGLASSTGLIARLLSTRYMVWSGRISYSVYLVHFPLLLTAGALTQRAGITPGSPLALVALVATLLAVLGVGAATYHLVEEPARRALSRYADRRASRRPAAGTPQPS